MTVVIVNLAGVGLIVAIIWWFWLSKPKRPSSTAAREKSAERN